MPSKSKKSKSSGRFGARYGKKIKHKLVKVEEKQRLKWELKDYQKEFGNVLNAIKNLHQEHTI